MREAAPLSAAVLQSRLGLSDDEVIAVLGSDPLSVITGEEDLRSDVAVLVELTADFDPAVLRRWLRAAGPSARPLELLLARDFPAFEDALAELAERGFILRGGGGATGGAAPGV